MNLDDVIALWICSPYLNQVRARIKVPLARLAHILLCHSAAIILRGRNAIACQRYSILCRRRSDWSLCSATRDPASFGTVPDSQPGYTRNVRLIREICVLYRGSNHVGSNSRIHVLDCGCQLALHIPSQSYRRRP